jgi:hypothetical protein
MRQFIAIGLRLMPIVGREKLLTCRREVSHIGRPERNGSPHEETPSDTTTTERADRILNLPTSAGRVRFFDEPLFLVLLPRAAGAIHRNASATPVAP